MAQSGYTPILIYGSTTATNTPLAANLTTGSSGVELAINATDGKLFYKDNGGTVQVLASKATGSIGGSTTQVQYNSSGSLAANGNFTFDGTNVTVGGNTTSAAFIPSSSTVPTNGLYLSAANTVALATSTTNRMTIALGVQVGAPTGGDKGAGTINATGLYVNGTAVSTGGGTVTSVAQSFTGGIISVSGSPITTSGTLALTVAGTSGGIPYFSSTSAWASSALLAANAIMIGGGAGAAPSTTTTGTGVLTAIGNAVTGSGGIVLATAPTLTGAVTINAPASGTALTVTAATGGTTNAGITLNGSGATPSSAVTFSATAMTVDCTKSNVFTTTFTANVTTAPTISNPQDGQTINWFITQDATGSRTMTWPTSFKWAGGTAGVLSTAANSVDLLVATYRSSTGFWYASLSKGFA